MNKKKIVYLIRHAQSHLKASLHHSEWPLSTLGLRQAERLSDLLMPVFIQKIFSSPFVRCLQTVRPFSKKSGINIFIEEDLRERLIVKELVSGFNEIWRKSWEDFNFALPGCESSFYAQKRIVAAVVKILNENNYETIGISTHGNVIGLFLNYIDSTFGREQADLIKTPDVIKIIGYGDTLTWDRKFKLPGIEDIATDPSETPIDSEV